MSLFLWCYLSLWFLFCLVNLALFLRHPNDFSITHQAYCSFLAPPWKWGSFIVACSAMVIVAPYTGDPTWDYVDAFFMSTLTFITAPWAVGILFFSLKKRSFNRETLLAICLWLFSASWSYDLYLLIRDGYYPITWSANIGASSVLYCSAGLLWNLDWRNGRGVTFSFLEPDWLQVTPQASFTKVFWAALPFMLIAIVIVVYFLILEWPNLFGLK